jgi:hypothetical protein
MKLVVMGLAAVGLLLGGRPAQADTALMFVTPQNIQGSTFRLTHKAVRKNMVEFVIRRDIRNIDGPGRSGYLSNSKLDPKGLGTPVKLEEDDKTLTYRFSVPEEQVADSVFTLWGGGARGEGITFRFALAEFRKPKKE